MCVYSLYTHLRMRVTHTYIFLYIHVMFNSRRVQQHKRRLKLPIRFIKRHVEGGNGALDLDFLWQKRGRNRLHVLESFSATFLPRPVVPRVSLESPRRGRMQDEVLTDAQAQNTQRNPNRLFAHDQPALDPM